MLQRVSECMELVERLPPCSTMGLAVLSEDDKDDSQAGTSL